MKESSWNQSITNIEDKNLSSNQSKVTPSNSSNVMEEDNGEIGELGEEVSSIGLEKFKCHTSINNTNIDK